MSEEKIKSAYKLRKELMDLYDENPKDWHIFVGRDAESYSNTVFLHNNDLWVIKEFFINPFKSIGIGIKGEFRNEFMNLRGLHSYGFRPLIFEDWKKILVDKNIFGIRKFLEKIPLSLKEFPSVSDSLVVEGPIVSYNNPIKISKKQEELDMKLRRSLRKLIYNKYPDVMKAYV